MFQLIHVMPLTQKLEVLGIKILPKHIRERLTRDLDLARGFIAIIGFSRGKLTNQNLHFL